MKACFLNLNITCFYNSQIYKKGLKYFILKHFSCSLYIKNPYFNEDFDSIRKGIGHAKRQIFHHFQVIPCITITNTKFLAANQIHIFDHQTKLSVRLKNSGRNQSKIQIFIVSIFIPFQLSFFKIFYLHGLYNYGNSKINTIFCLFSHNDGRWTIASL